MSIDISVLQSRECFPTFAIPWRRGQPRLESLAAMLGHSKINMVLRYARPTQEHQTKAMQKMEQFVIGQKIAIAEQRVAATSHAIQ